MERAVGTSLSELLKVLCCHFPWQPCGLFPLPAARCAKYAGCGTKRGGGVVVVSHGSDSPVTVYESVNLYWTLIGHLRMTVKAGSQFWGFT